ncbi:Exosome complex component RRP4 [Gracilariopsis chorda]|uniref:Exosome complex component RRP4 n=1 Tax=Gracilariopsis chorda TaxID=448386 RepID=A0A2V3IQJ5_9FLOR|nr:Exosome complex component RRP4 [Gracilariopsis chorda]|eukprot:PXF44358.1 Exosome complex component RRP4 [Gracilariopsis chorda]
MEAQRSSSASFTILRPKRLSDNAEAVSRLSHVPITSPGSVILTEDHSVRVRRTLLSCGESGNVLTATRAGFISRVNKLVMVVPLCSRYILETGDVVGGRVVEIASKRYKMDVNATKLAFLLLTAIKLPGGVHRRRNQEDELNMREYCISKRVIWSVLKFRNDEKTAASPSTRECYGIESCPVDGGQLVTLQSELVKRAKKHFHELPCGVHMTLRDNGFVFLSQTRKNAILLQIWWRIGRVSNNILALDSEFNAIGPDTIMYAYETSPANGMEVKDMCTPDVVKIIGMGARSMREAARERFNCELLVRDQRGSFTTYESQIFVSGMVRREPLITNVWRPTIRDGRN